ncbi:hypothetical protein [Actinobacillus seminis]|uniref:hypothetical protein n=1 Tax=Actinobacillus seminis TaxID=722 RepID=UPI0013035B05
MLDLHGKVIYLGSFSKLIMQGLRISFMVLPKSLLGVYHQYCDFFILPFPALSGNV